MSLSPPPDEEDVEANAEDETMEYWIFPESDGLTISDVLSEAFAVSGNYLWHDEPFRLCERTVPQRHFYGRTRFGENYDDEWFLVFILYHISGVFTELVIKCRDGDGEFLLINAADVVPHWVNPNTAKNRVFIHRGCVHLIPHPSDVDVNVNIPKRISSVAEGVRIVRSFPQLTKAPVLVQRVTNVRISGYPRKMEDNWHHVGVLLPESLAKTVNRFPHTVAAAIHAFYLRDAIDYKACRELKNFFPCKLKLTRVKFTKHLYAMLAQQHFYPDRRSPWSLPPRDDPLYKASALGLKLTAGFEILYCQEMSKPTIPKKKLPNCRRSAEWYRFYRTLTELGYFEDETEGSKRHTLLADRAWDFFESNTSTASFDSKKNIQQLVSEASELDDVEDSLDSATLSDDDESWLTVTPESLEKAINQTNGEGYTGDSKDSSEDTCSESQEPSSSWSSLRKGPPIDQSILTDKMTKFLHKTSSYEGVTLPTDKDKLNLVPERFAESVKRMLDLDIPASDKESESSDFGNDDDDYSTDLSEDELQEMEHIDQKMKEYMKIMDSELNMTDVGRSFARKKNDGSPSKNSIDQEDDDFKPVDIDRNLVSNMLQSYWSEKGMGGPASSLLRSLNVNPPMIPEELDSDDEEDINE